MRKKVKLQHFTQRNKEKKLQNPEVVEVNLQRALKAFETGDHQTAISLLYQSNQPDTLQTLALKARVWEKEGKHIYAQSNWARAAALAPDDVGTLIAWGVNLIHLSYLYAAERVLEFAMAHNPEIADIYACLTDIYSRRELNAQALDAIEHALRLRPEVEPWIRQRGALLEYCEAHPREEKFVCNVYPECDMYQDYFRGWWRVGVQPAFEGALIPFVYLDKPATEEFGVWQFERLPSKIPSAIGRCTMELHLEGEQTNRTCRW